MEWSQKGLPHKGWIYNGVEDTGCLSSSCEMCGNTIRYVHYLSHPTYTMKIGVGCICSEKLTDDYVTPKEREKAIIHHENGIQPYKDETIQKGIELS